MQYINCFEVKAHWDVAFLKMKTFLPEMKRNFNKNETKIKQNLNEYQAKNKQSHAKNRTKGMKNVFQNPV